MALPSSNFPGNLALKKLIFEKMGPIWVTYMLGPILLSPYYRSPKVSLVIFYSTEIIRAMPQRIYEYLKLWPIDKSLILKSEVDRVCVHLIFMFMIIYT